MTYVVKPFPLERPCEASWDDMRPVREGRHCARCDRVVYDLSRLSETRVRALATLLGPTGFCARQTLDENGELLLAPAGAPPRPRSARWAGSTLAVLSVAGCASAAVQPAARPALVAAPQAATCAAGPTTDAAPADAHPRPAATAASPAAPDRDLDGVPDATDRCPDEPGAPPDGCPSRIRIGGIAPNVRAQIWFGRRSTRLRGDMQPLLAEVAGFLARDPGIRRIAVVGHASQDEGPDARALGRRRAEAVRDALVTLGVDPLRLTRASWGSERPSAAQGEGGRPERDRRVEFVVCVDTACDGLPPD